jgi:hypothetical protein
MTEEDQLELNFTPSVKKLLKKKVPSVKPKPATIGVLALCVRAFMDQLVEKSAVVCDELGKNQMSGKHVLTALEGLGFQKFLGEMETKDKQIVADNAERKRMFSRHPISDRTPEENQKLMEQLRKEALEAVRQRKANPQ